MEILKAERLKRYKKFWKPKNKSKKKKMLSKKKKN
jgi:hypothetical protein